MPLQLQHQRQQVQQRQQHVQQQFYDRGGVDRDQMHVGGDGGEAALFAPAPAKMMLHDALQLFSLSAPLVKAAAAPTFAPPPLAYQSAGLHVGLQLKAASQQCLGSKSATPVLTAQQIGINTIYFEPFPEADTSQ